MAALYGTLLCVGTLKEDYLVKAVAEYKKRISAYMRLEEIVIREEKLSDESPAAVAAALATVSSSRRK